MNLTHFIKSARFSLKITAFFALFFSLSNSAFAFADMFSWITPSFGSCTLDCAHWYAGAHFGMSHLFDKRAPGSVNSVDENGPGWNVDAGYQFNSMLGAELGYIQYYNSRETVGSAFAGSITVAKTEHHAVYLAATGRYPLYCQFSALGKLGVAYSYANKIFLAGPSASSGAGSLFYALGIDYSVTPRADFIAQWSRVRGNNYTGSSDLYSVGLNFAIV